MTTRTLAVLGTYRSGSSMVAAMLHELGVDMGAPFGGEFFEPLDLAQSLRRWWSEPHLVATESASIRVLLLRQWLDSRASHGGWVGAKHPLLCLSAEDVLRGWGADTKLVWCHRSLDAAIASLARMQWWSDAADIQRKLYVAAERLFARCPGLVLEFEETLAAPSAAVERLVEFLGLEPSDSQIAAAAAAIDPQRGQLRTPPAVAAAARARPAAPIIAATMLAANSQTVIGEALQSILKWVDRILLIDTGVEDHSLEIAQSLAGDKLVVHQAAWNESFADARNQALDFAQSEQADWALTLDTDERLHFAPQLTERQALDRLLTQSNVDVWLVPATDGSYTKERFIRLPTQLRWQGRVHEALRGPLPPRRGLLSQVSFSEHAKEPVELTCKLERDAGILREDLRRDPADGRSWFYLGQTLAGLQQHEGAVAAWDRCAAARHWDELAAWACFMAAKSLAQLGLYHEAVERCAWGLAIDAYYPELAWMSGWCQYQQQEYRQATVWSEMAIGLGCVEGVGESIQRIGFRDLVGWYEGPFDVLSHALHGLGESAASRHARQQHHHARQLRRQHTHSFPRTHHALA